MQVGASKFSGQAQLKPVAVTTPVPTMLAQTPPLKQGASVQMSTLQLSPMKPLLHRHCAPPVIAMQAVSWAQSSASCSVQIKIDGINSVVVVVDVVMVGGT